MAYVYLHSEEHLWTVGFYKPDGKFEPESDYQSDQAAAARVHYLNGGGQPSGYSQQAITDLALVVNQIAREVGVTPMPMRTPLDLATPRDVTAGVITLADALRARLTRPPTFSGEPFFVLRAHDRFAPETIEHWIVKAAVAGAPHAKVIGAAGVASAMRQWQRLHGSKVPD